MEETPAVCLRNVTKSFGSDRKALDDVSLEIRMGSIVGLVGPNGSGKSTLLSIVAGLKKPTSGAAHVLERPVGVQTKELVFYTGPKTALCPFATAGESVRLMQALFPGFDPETALRLLSEFGVPLGKRIGAMSLGIAARFSLAMALARRAPVTLLDEPFLGVDLVVKDALVRAILAEHRPETQTIVMATHEIECAEPLFDRIVFLKDGQVDLDGAVDSLREVHGYPMSKLFKEVYAQ